MVVGPDDEWHFAHVLPALTAGERIILVIPSDLQIEWMDSPPYFCAASEAARNVAELKTSKSLLSLPPHLLEQHTLPEDYKIPEPPYFVPLIRIVLEACKLVISFHSKTWF